MAKALKVLDKSIRKEVWRTYEVEIGLQGEK